MHTGVRIDPAASVQLDARTWQAIIDSLPERVQKRARKHSGEYQRFVESVIWVAWVDARWPELPADRGAWRSVRGRFLHWNRCRLWEVVAPHIGPEASVHLLLRVARAGQPQSPGD
ncbi:transposase [Lysobacter arenosi]|uniref:Transposase n=1 Tax=Lysobacter arenosi TaxID=2795387 RepID=A0ABX7RA52_9GAMM|nr:transposase [Lysobacter arenosi]QSX73872.1 transposase [Lysobacter arenosi]